MDNLQLLVLFFLSSIKLWRGDFLKNFCSFFLNFGTLYRTMGSKIKNKITKDATLKFYI